MPKKNETAAHWDRFKQAVREAISAPPEKVEEREKSLHQRLKRHKAKSSNEGS